MRVQTYGSRLEGKFERQAPPSKDILKVTVMSCSVKYKRHADLSIAMKDG